MHTIECIVFHNLCIDSLDMHTIKLHSLILHINSVDIASMFWLITSLIFNGFSIQKKIWECWEPGLSNQIFNLFNQILYVNSVNHVDITSTLLH